MNADLEALARRAVACRHWRWMLGMTTQGGCRVLRRDPDGYTIGYPVKIGHMTEVRRDALPDLSDPATLGCLLALVREAWGDPCATSRAYCGYWGVLRPDGDMSCWHIARGATEAEALVFALEAAS